ncbi:type II secretion system protein GspL [Pseudomonas putida]|uniref:Type II secretion system protein GspL n=1 Tax=Pseudomonas putida TaxID=303 RepID=A0A1X0ZWL3_PSEPU|nr:type II secretion system protein GspL [Pseudomonas putida]MEB3899379.1 type II secretion system protein GspL [Pseudomonas putida]ORL64073.1 type II secretion system protein GspL [Pseudomonas putida]
MKREWRRSAPARPWLLLRPGQADAPWDWLLVDGDTPLRQGQGEPPAEPHARVALVVPGEACSHFQVPAPAGLRREEWPLLLEDQLLQDPQSLACANLARLAGQVRLVVVARQQLEAWQAQCATWGLPLERCWAEFQLLPAPTTGTAWQWRKLTDMRLFRGVLEDGREHWLAWPQTLGEAPRSPWAGLPMEVMEGAWPTHLANLDALPGLFAQQRTQTWRRPQLPRVHLRLMLACLLLCTLWAGLWTHQQWRQAQLWRAQVHAVVGQQASPRQAAQALKRLQGAETERQLRLRQLEDLQTRLQAWLREQPAWRLQAVRFDGRRWHLRMEGDGAAPPWDAMASGAGVRVEVQGDGQAGQWHVVFDLGDAT